MGSYDLTNIILHEFAHACGLPAEDSVCSTDNGGPGGWRAPGGGCTLIAPPPWDKSGVPGTTTGGAHKCTGK